MPETVTIPIDPQTARAYNSASPEQKKKMEAVLGLWLRALTSGQYPLLQKALDEIGQKVEARGLTPEILESLLKGECST